MYIWLTRDEVVNQPLNDLLEVVYKEWHRKKYQVVVFKSGEGDLVKHVCDILIHANKIYEQQKLDQSAVK